LAAASVALAAPAHAGGPRTVRAVHHERWHGRHRGSCKKPPVSSGNPSGSTGQAASIVAGGTPVKVTVGAAGQSVRLTFTGTAGERIAAQLSWSTIPSGTLSILRPDGTTLASTPFAGAGAFLDPVQLPAGGTYALLLAPAGASAGSATVALLVVPPDATATIAPGGPPVTVGTTAPGQNVRLTFAG